MQKEWFPLIKYPVPDELEYFLEQKASEGLFLQPVGQKGVFYYEFDEGKASKCKYMVDLTYMPKTVYFETLFQEGWEYMGSSGNCYIWKKAYEGDKRPKDMSDRLCKLKHCRNGAILSLIMGLLFMALAIGLIWGFYSEMKLGVNKKHYFYIAEAIINFPISIVFLNVARKFSDGMGLYKR